MSMYQEQMERLLAQKALGLNEPQANSIVARAYGYTSLDLSKNQLAGPIDGLMKVKSPVEIKAIPDRVLQMMEFVRMAQNMGQPGLPNILESHPQGTLIATMWGFSDFNALKVYAQSDRIDQTSTDPKEMARFKQRSGFMPPSQFLLGRGYAGHTLIIHTHPSETTQWINQELCLNSLADLQVAVVRATPDGDDYINRYSKNHDVFRQPLSENHSSTLLGARVERPANRLAISLVPDQVYTLEQLVAAHYAALGENSVKGRTLIIDRLRVEMDVETLTAGFTLANGIGLNLVYVTDTPDDFLWDRFQSRLIFGFNGDVQKSASAEMNSALIFASPFIGLDKHNLKLAYHSVETGPVYGTVQLVPDEAPKGAQIMKRRFGTARLG